MNPDTCHRTKMLSIITDKLLSLSFFYKAIIPNFLYYDSSEMHGTQWKRKYESLISWEHVFSITQMEEMPSEI